MIIPEVDMDTKKLFWEIFNKLTLKKFIQVEPTLSDIFIKLVQSDTTKGK